MKKIPAAWLKEKGIELAVDDKWSIDGKTGSVAIHDVDWFNNANDKIDLCITSFADRPNTGKQPVADWVPVDYTCPSGAKGSNQLSSSLYWSLTDNIGDIKYWCLNFDALHDIYTKEKEATMWNKLEQMTETAGYYCVDNRRFYRAPKAGSMAEVLVGDTRWQVSDCTTIKELDDGTFFKLERVKESIDAEVDDKPAIAQSAALKKLIYVCDGLSQEFRSGNVGNASDWLRHVDLAYQDYENTEDEQLDLSSVKAEEKPVFTQPMADAGELPPVGCEVEYNTASRGDVIGIVTGYRTCKALNTLADNCDYRVFIKFEHNERLLKDIQPIDTGTDEEKAMEDLSNLVGDCEPDWGILKAIKSGKIHGVKWVGE